MNKFKNFCKKYFVKFCSDKKFNSIVLAVLELPLLIIGLIKSKYDLILFGVIGMAILNALIKKVYQIILAKKIKAYFIENSKKGVDVE